MSRTPSISTGPGRGLSIGGGPRATPKPQMEAGYPEERVDSGGAAPPGMAWDEVPGGGQEVRSGGNVTRGAGPSGTTRAVDTQDYGGGAEAGILGQGRSAQAATPNPMANVRSSTQQGAAPNVDLYDQAYRTYAQKVGGGYDPKMAAGYSDYMKSRIAGSNADAYNAPRPGSPEAAAFGNKDAAAMVSRQQLADEQYSNQVFGRNYGDVEALNQTNPTMGGQATTAMGLARSADRARQPVSAAQIAENRALNGGADEQQFMASAQEYANTLRKSGWDDQQVNDYLAQRRAEYEKGIGQSLGTLNNAQADRQAAQIPSYQRQVGAVTGWNMPQYAHGTDFHPGGNAIVGEEGPEIVKMPRGSKVMPVQKKPVAPVAPGAMPGKRMGQRGGGMPGMRMGQRGDEMPGKHMEPPDAPEPAGPAKPQQRTRKNRYG